MAANGVPEFPLDTILGRVFDQYVVSIYKLDGILERLFPGYDSMYETYKGKPTQMSDMILMMRHGEELLRLMNQHLFPHPQYHDFSLN